MLPVWKESLMIRRHCIIHPKRRFRLANITFVMTLLKSVVNIKSVDRIDGTPILIKTQEF